MKVVYSGEYIKVLPQDTPIDANMLMGWSRRRNDPWLKVEDNLVNRLVLGLPINLHGNYSGTQFDKTDLLNHQVADVEKMFQLQHFGNFNPMGLGKTIETARYLSATKPRSCLIVCPKIIRSQWASKLEQWGHLKCEIFERQRAVREDGTVWIINYEKLRDKRTRDKFKNFVWQYLVVDEAHLIKSRDSKQTLAVKDLPAQHRAALTGTPILRYTDDLWSILNFIDPWYSGKSYWNFANYFCSFDKNPWNRKIVGLSKNPAKVAILNKLLSLISIRNDAVSVTPGKRSEVVKLPMSKKQRELYRDERNLLIDRLPENLTIPNGAVLMMRLMQTTSWPGMYVEGEVGPKFEWILEACKNNPNEKFVVFSIFEQVVTALTQWLNENLINTVCITGKNTDDANELAKDMFVSGNSQVIAGTIKAMGTGYDGLQEASRIVIFIDRPWSPELASQAEERLNRYGQKHFVDVYYLECQGSIDQHVGKVNITKANDIREALNSEEYSST